MYFLSVQSGHYLRTKESLGASLASAQTHPHTQTLKTKNKKQKEKRYLIFRYLDIILRTGIYRYVRLVIVLNAYLLHEENSKYPQQHVNTKDKRQWEQQQA